MSTLGTDDKNFDWEDAWRQHLDAPEPPQSGKILCLCQVIAKIVRTEDCKGTQGQLANSLVDTTFGPLATKPDCRGKILHLASRSRTVCMTLLKIF